jgi:UDP-2-acetamido-3-amino-2,3-dideoxy-glucuronate N-acetyltransferase
MNTAPAPMPTGTYFVHPAAIVESSDIGPRTRVWAFAHVMSGAQVGSDCNICEQVFIEAGAVLGNNVTVKNGVAVWRGVVIEDNVFLGPNCVLTNDHNPRAYIKRPELQLDTTTIRSNATIGANATIVCGLAVGNYAFVGAGAVIIRPVPDFALMVGNPARHIGWMCVCAKRLPLSASCPVGFITTCPACRRRFRAEAEGLAEVKG